MVRFLASLGVIVIGITITAIATPPYHWVRSETTTAPSEQETNLHEISIGWVGDMVPALDPTYNSTVFDAVTVELQKPTLMMGNLEGTFATEDTLSKCRYLTSSCHAFRGDESFAQALKTAGFDFVSLVNNHSYDYGDEGLLQTERVLDAYNIPYISPTKPYTSLVVSGKRIGILGLSSTPPTRTITDYNYIQTRVQELKQTNDIVIVIFHGGAEGKNKTETPGTYEYQGSENRGNVVRMAETAIDAGADMVLGSGPHVLRKLSYYKQKPIVYSAGNFVGGNERLITTGPLGVSAIFTIQTGTSSFTHTVIPILLSQSGIPTIDPDGNALRLLKELEGME